MKKYIVLGGVNGAGKSTLYQILDNLTYCATSNRLCENL